MTLEQRREEIVSTLEERATTSKLSQRIKRCSKGRCRRCGDLCPVKAEKWKDENLAKIVRLLTNGRSPPAWKLRFTRENWIRPDGQLALPCVGKNVRRSVRQELRRPLGVLWIGSMRQILSLWVCWMRGCAVGKQLHLIIPANEFES
jgi:hypothetical protein